MHVVLTKSFQRSLRKLHQNQKRDLDNAVKTIMQEPKIGEKKIGDLSGLLVHKFRMIDMLTLIAYTYDGETITLMLIAFGSHENFYRDLKKSIK